MNSRYKPIVHEVGSLMELNKDDYLDAKIKTDSMSVESQVTDTINQGNTLTVFSLPVIEFASAKFLVSIYDQSNDNRFTAEILADHLNGEPRFAQYNNLGNMDVDIEFRVEDGLLKFLLTPHVADVTVFVQSIAIKQF